MAGVLLVMTAAFLPETLRKTKQAQVIEKEIDQDHVDVDKTAAPVEKSAAPVQKTIAATAPSFWATLSNSFKPMITMLHDPTVLLLTAYNTVIFACLYFLVSHHLNYSPFPNYQKCCCGSLISITLLPFRTQQSLIHSRKSMATLNGK